MALVPYLLLLCLVAHRWSVSTSCDMASRCVLFRLRAILAPCRVFLCESLGNGVRQPGSRSQFVLHSLSSVGCFMEATSSLVVWLFHWCVHACSPLRPAVTSCLWWVGFPTSSWCSLLWQSLWCMSARLSNMWVRSSLVKPWKKCALTFQHFRIGL